MTICPIALVVHCVGCPLVKICPGKNSLGDYGKYVPPTGATNDPDTAASAAKADDAPRNPG